MPDHVTATCSRDGDVVTLTEGYVPVIDLGRDKSSDVQRRAAVARAIARACEASGFLVIVGHGIPEGVITDMYRVMESFFARSTAEKSRVAADDSDPLMRGYHVRSSRHEQFYANILGEDSRDAEPPWGDPRLLVPNKWPDDGEFRRAYLAYHAAVEELSRDVLRLFAIALGIPEGWLVDLFEFHMSPLTTNYYPPQPVPPGDDELRNEKHRDWSALTILYQDDAPGGLQVAHHSGRWVDVPAISGSFVVNLGRLMAVWTNDRWASTVHRVVNPPREVAHRHRISVGFFFHPSPDVIVRPIAPLLDAGEAPRYEPVRSSDFFVSRSAKARASRRQT
ncbi:isopenicillin N synthase family dioxygenase [Streptomyces sp. LZ34]